MSDPGIRIDLTGPRGDELSFRADAVLPAQFYPARRGAASVEPIRRLMAGILIDAVRCFQRNFEARSSDRRQKFREARVWIFDDKGNGPFSFQSVCDSLEIDPRSLRNSIVGRQKDRRSGEKQRMIRRSPVNIAGRNAIAAQTRPTPRRIATLKRFTGQTGTIAAARGVSVNDHLNVKSHPGFERKREAKSILRMWVASAIIAVATSAWGCSSRAESCDDWLDSSPYALSRYSPANISVTSASVAYVYLGDDPAVVRSGYTDPGWERADLRWERAGEASFPAANNRVFEIPPMLDWNNTAAAILIPGDGD
jgi:hypothetical protein